jgi:hypothetical protein
VQNRDEFFKSELYHFINENSVAAVFQSRLLAAVSYTPLCYSPVHVVLSASFCAKALLDAAQC